MSPVIGIDRALSGANETNPTNGRRLSGWRPPTGYVSQEDNQL